MFSLEPKSACVIPLFILNVFKIFPNKIATPLRFNNKLYFNDKLTVS
ncbi:helix-turn-helix transcriptional regulator [Listeria phage FHC174-PLM34]|nr:helix-turn-helix transcriptional regulator [Listeria phage FHC174-PLM34]